jgi:hypothetical protein
VPKEATFDEKIEHIISHSPVAVRIGGPASSINLPGTSCANPSTRALNKLSTFAGRLSPLVARPYTNCEQTGRHNSRSGRCEFSSPSLNSHVQRSAQALEEPLAVLRSIFPSKQLNKGAPLVVHSQPSKDGVVRSLIFEGLGQVDNAWVSKEFFKAYFVGEGNSPAVEHFIVVFEWPRNADDVPPSS